jgi:YNFM family putative membrane transporter
MNAIRQWHYRHTVLALCVLAYFAIRFIEFALALVFPDIQEALGTTVFTIGVAVTSSTITYAIPQLPSGALGDRFGERTVIMAALGLTGLGSLILTITPAGSVLVVGMALIGIVSGAYYSPATSLLTDLFDDTGRAIGIHRVGAQVVGFTGPVVAFVVAAHGWRVVPLLSVLVTVPVLVGFGLFVRSSTTNPERSIRERIHPSVLVGLVSQPRIAFTTAIASFGQFVDTATFSFLPYILREYHDLSLPMAGVLFTLYFVVLTVAQPIAGWLSDYLGCDSVAIVALLFGFAGYLALLAQGVFPVVVASVVLVGLGMGWSPPVQSRAIDLLDETERATGFGLIRTVYIAAASLCGVVIAGAVTIAGWTSAIVLLAVGMVVPAVALGANALFRVGL